MKPTFALDLTRDTAALLHRTPKGWLPIGEVAFDAADLDEALDYLRKTALGLSPMGMATKIILPASQILYTEVHAPGPSRDEKRRQIAAALEWRTPYPVEDLVFDWSGKGATVKVAVVARETLEEAEGFAVAHRLNPVSFVAIPEAGSFVGEAWFGPTAAAATLLADGEKVERDREPVTILNRDLPAPDTETAVAEVPEEPPVTAEAPAAVSAGDEDPLPGLEEALNGDLPGLPSDSVEGAAPVAQPAEDALTEELLSPEPDDQGDSLPGGQSPEPEDLAKPVASNGPDTTETDVVAEPDASASEAPAPAAVAPVSAPEAEEAPFAHVTDPAVFPDGDDDLPPAPPSAAMVAFASRRSAGAAGAVSATGAARPVHGANRAEPATGAAARLGTPIPRPVPPKAGAGLVTAPSIPGTRAKPKAKLPISAAQRPPIAGPTTVKSPARPGGTFGASAPPRSRPGIVFMVLVALLLLFLALVAAWSSFYLARYDDTSAVTVDVAADAVPGIDDEMLADMQDPAEMTGPIPEAGGPAGSALDPALLATESLPVNIGGTAADETTEPTLSELVAPAGPEAEALAATETEVAAAADEVIAPAAEPIPEAVVDLAAEPAPGTTVTTELPAAAAPVEDMDEIFLSAMDAPPPALDALALPTPAPTGDLLPETPMPPPAFGTVYQFDANGLLKPTADGILSPDGVMLIAGKPPLLPPSRSEAATAAAAAAAPPAPPEALAETPATEAGPATAADASLVASGTPAPDSAEVVATPADPALAGFRPRPRPETLVPDTADDDARLNTETGSDVVTLRPLARPASVLAAASASRPDTGTAVADLGAQGASLAAQAEAQLAAAAALEEQNPSIVAISMRPAARPNDLSRAVEAAVAAAVRAPDPEPEVIAAAAAPDPKPEELDELDEPEVSRAAPSIPTKASVAKQATYTKAINLKKLNLIGTYGTDSRRYALIRQSNGSYKKVKVGDRIDGGTIQAITETEVRYQKGGKLLSLKMPKA